MAGSLRFRAMVWVLGLLGLAACSDDSTSPVSQPQEPPDPLALPAFVGEWDAPEASGDIAVSVTGNVYVAAFFEGIYEYSAGGSARGKWAPTSSSGDEILPAYLECTADPRNSCYIVSATPSPTRVVVFDARKSRQDEWEEKYVTDAWAGGVDQIAVSPAGEIYRLRFDEESVVKYAANGEFEREWLTHGSTPGVSNRPGGIAATDERVYIADTQNDRILMFSPGGLLLDEFGSAGNRALQFHWPTGLAIDGGVLYVVDRINSRVQKLTLDGQYLTGFSSGTDDSPELLAVRGRHVYLLHEGGLIRHFQYGD